MIMKRCFMAFVVITVLVVWFYIHFIRVSMYGFCLNHSKKVLPKSLDLFRSENVTYNKCQCSVVQMIRDDVNYRIKKKEMQIIDVVQNAGSKKKTTIMLHKNRNHRENMSYVNVSAAVAELEIKEYLQNIGDNAKRNKCIGKHQCFSKRINDDTSEAKRHRNLSEHKMDISISPIKTIPDTDIRQRLDISDNLKNHLENVPLNQTYNKVFKQRTLTSVNQQYIPRYQLSTVPRKVSKRQGSALNSFRKQFSNHEEIVSKRKTLFLTKVHKQVQLKVKNQTCNKCFDHNFSYIINNVNICRKKTQMNRIHLFIMIFSTHKNLKRRDAIRKTWLTYTKQNTGPIRYAFLLGNQTDDSLQEKVLQENSLHNDIIQENFVDSYMNLTYKTIMGFKWVVNYCPTTRYVFKTDDDMFINIPNLMKFLESSGGGLDTVIAGNCFTDARPVRDKSSKWYVPFENYNKEIYPSYCAGTGYLTSFKVVDKIYMISPSVSYFPFEDVYVGFCLREIGGKVKKVKGFYSYQPRIDACVYKGDSLFTATWITPEQMENIWKTKCVNITDQPQKS